MGWIVAGDLFAQIDISGRMSIGDVWLGPVPPFPIRDAEISIEHSVDASGYIRTDVPESRYRGNSFFWFSVDVEEPEEALRVAERKLPQLGLTLSVGLRQRVGLAIAAAFRDGEKIEPRGTAVIRMLRPTTIDQDDVSCIWRTLDRSSLLDAAIKHLYNGRRLLDAVSTETVLLQDAALLEFAKSVEHVANVVAKGVPVGEGLDEKRAAVLRDLQSVLVGPRAMKKKITAVNSARDKLFRLDARFATERVQQALEYVGLGGAWIVAARELFDARSKRVAHPGGGLSRSDRSSLLDGTVQFPAAEQLAETFIARAAGIDPSLLPLVGWYSKPPAERKREAVQAEVFLRETRLSSAGGVSPTISARMSTSLAEEPKTPSCD